MNPDHRCYANTLKGVEIFAAGVHNGDTYTEKDLDALAAASKNLDYKPALKLGHVKDKPGEPAYGYVENLRRDGAKLKADFTHVHDSVVEAIRQRAYDRVSSEIFHNLKRGGRLYDRALKAVALLGAEIPAVAGLKPLHELAFAATEFTAVKAFELKLDVPAQAIMDAMSERLTGVNAKLNTLLDKESEMDPKQEQELKDLRAEVAQLNTQLKTFADAHSAEAKETKDALASANAKIAELSLTGRRETIDAKLKGLKVPAFAPAIGALYSMALADEGKTKVKFFAADGKEAEHTMLQVVDGFVVAINDQAAKLFKALGTTPGRVARAEGPSDDEPVDVRVDKLTKEYQLKHNVKSYEEAMTKVLASDPQLSAEYKTVLDKAN